MIKYKFISIYFVACLLLMVFPLNNSQVFNKAMAAPDDGIDGYQALHEDWTVTGYEEYSNETIALYGDLTIKNNGQLVLNNCTLMMMSSFLQPYSIIVKNGGIMEMYGCYITDTPNDNDSDALSAWYYFAARGGSKLIIENSTIRQCGFLDITNVEHLGLSVGTNKGHILNTRLNTSTMGLTFWGNNTGFRVENLNLSQISMTGIYMLNGEGVAINNASFINIGESSALQVQNSKNFTIEKIRLTGERYIYIEKSSGFTIKNIIGPESERLIRIDDSSDFEVRDILFKGNEERNYVIQVSGCSNVIIDNITASDDQDIVVIEETFYAKITNITGFNISNIIGLYDSEYVEISDLAVDKGTDTLWMRDANRISIDNINFNNVAYPIRTRTLTNSTISNVTIINPLSLAIDFTSNSRNVTLSNAYLKADTVNFTFGINIDSSEVYMNDLNLYDFNWSIYCLKGEIYGENIYIDGIYEGERGIVLSSITNSYLSNITVQNQKWDGIRVEKSGQGNIRMDQIYINNTETGIDFRESNTTISGLVIDNTSWNLSAFDGSEVIIMNSTIGRLNIINSDVTCINTTNTTSASIFGSSTLTKKWWVDVFVNDSVGPVAGATVKIYDGTPSLEITSTTGSNGFARDIPVNEVVYTPAIDSKNPHRTTAEGPGWFASNATLYQVTRNLWVNVSYNKNAPPQPPKNLHAISDQNSNTVLTWDPSISQDVNYYNIYIAKSLANLNQYLISGIPNVTVSESSYTHMGGSGDWQKFWYGVKANDSENESINHAQASCGNWVVNNTIPQYISGENITLKGSLFVFGFLELKYTTLKIDSSSKDLFGININDSASFNCENITIKRNNTRPYYFIINPDSFINMNNSAIIFPGIDKPGIGKEKFMEGVHSLTKNLTITNTTFHVRYGGLRIYQTYNFQGRIFNVTFLSEFSYVQVEYLLIISSSTGVNITNCNLNANAKYGIYAYSSNNLKIYQSDVIIKNDYKTTCWAIFLSNCKNSKIFNNNMIFGNPAIYIYESVNITIESSIISAHKTIGISGDSSWYTTINNCSFGRYDGDNPRKAIYMSRCRYSIIEDMDVYDLSQYIEMDNESASVIRNVRITNGDIGIFLKNSNNIYVNDTNISFIFTGMMVTGCHDISLFNTEINLTFFCLEINSPGPVNLINCSIQNGISNEILAEGYKGQQGNVVIINSTISSLSDSSLELNHSAVVFLINTSFNFSKLKIGDSASRVEVFHLVSIQVYDIDDQQPVWANITISNVKDKIVYHKQVNNGLAKWVSIHHKTIFKEDEYIDNPHNIYVFDGSHIGMREFYINETGHIDVNVSNKLPWLSSVDIFGYYDMPDPEKDITTYEPTTKFVINLTYLYKDPENDLESGSRIQWYVNGVYNSTFDGKVKINAKYTSKYQTWQAIVYPSDGYDITYPSYPYESNVLYIENTPPEVTNVTISPSEPIGGDDLSVNYDTYDIDKDGLVSSKTTHKWYYYNNTINDWIYSNIDSNILPSTYTSKAERWRCEVTPNDGDDEGLVVLSQEVVIGNTAPTASNAKITPVNPRSNETIKSSYNYFDLDSDQELGSIIRWFKNDIEQTELEGSQSVSPSKTKKAEKWQYLIIPSDGEDFGEPLESEIMVIGNTAPLVSNFTILPTNPTTSDNLTVIYEFIDDDFDSESFDTNVQWLRKREGDIAFTPTGLRVKTLSSVYTTKNEVWTCEVTPHDHFAYGKTVRVEVSVTIKNSKPTVSDIYITPESPTTKTILEADYEYIDLDNDVESGTEIKWFRNDIEVNELKNNKQVPNTHTAKGQSWYFTVRPNDDQEFGGITKSAIITIENSPPTAENVSILPKSPTGKDDLQASYTYKDEDGDIESAPKIMWFENGIHQPEFDDQLNVNSFAVKKGKNWHFDIKVFDGIDYSNWVSSNHPEIANTLVSAKSIIPDNTIFKTVIINETETQIFQINTIDPDGDLILYYWRLDGQLVGQDYFYSFITNYEGEHSAGRYNLTLEFREFGETDFNIIEWEIIVQNVNRKPSIDSWDPISRTSRIKEEKSLTFSVSASDPDSDDTLTFIWYFDNNEVPGQSGSSYAYTGKGEDIGDHTVKVEVKDKANSKAEYSWNVTVKEEVAKDLLYGYSYDWWGLIIAIISGIIAAMMFIFGLLKMRKKKSKLREYMGRIEDITESDKPPHDKENELKDLKKQIKDEFSKEMIIENHYIILEREVDNAIGDVRTEIVEERVALPDELKLDVEGVLEDGIVTKREYTALVDKIKTTKDLNAIERSRLQSLLTRWMMESKKEGEQKSRRELKSEPSFKLKPENNKNESENGII